MRGNVIKKRNSIVFENSPRQPHLQARSSPLPGIREYGLLKQKVLIAVASDMLKDQL